MLGFHAEAVDTAININRDELQDARWFTRAELLSSPENETFRLPRRISIARQLVDHWLRGD
jgi:NAD+ diphosphatase